MEKKLVSFVLLFMIASCSTESSRNEFVENAEFNAVAMIPGNQANPYDTKGEAYYRILSAYLKNNDIPNSIKKTADQIQYLSQNCTDFYLVSQSPESVSIGQVSLLMSNLENQAKAIIENSDLSTGAKLDLTHLILTVIGQQGSDYLELYKYIVSYEAAILAKEELNEDEKEIILSLSSVTRYTLYAIDGHRDRDWEISVANKIKRKTFNSYQASIVSVITLFRQLK